MGKVSAKLESFLGLALYRTGLFRVLLSRNRRKERVPILMYHSISDGEENSFKTLSSKGMVVTRDTFASHIDFISENFDVIPLARYIEYRQGKGGLPSRPIVITFDDGFRDLKTVADEVLEDKGCHSTTFLIGAALDRRSSVWLHRLYYILDNGGRERLTTRALEGAGLLSALPEGGGLAKRIADHLAELDEAERDRFLSGLAEALGVDDSGFVDSYYLTAGEVKDLERGPFDFGSHTMTHSRLSDLDSETKLKELVESKKTVEDLTGGGPIPFAFPFGNRGSWDEESVELIRKTGYSCALTTIEGLNGPETDIFSLRRIEVNEVPVHTLLFRATGARGLIKEIARRLTGRASH